MSRPPLKTPARIIQDRPRILAGGFRWKWAEQFGLAGFGAHEQEVPEEKGAGDFHLAHDLKLELDYPRSFESLGDFTRAVADAIAADDQALTDYLLVNFRVGQDNVFWIGD